MANSKQTPKKTSSKKKSAVIRVYNCSKQMIPLQVRPPGSDFFSNEQQVRLQPNKEALLPKSHIRMEQIRNLQSRRMLRVLYDSETQEEQRAAANS
jgi:hypothetical protein